MAKFREVSGSNFFKGTSFVKFLQRISNMIKKLNVKNFKSLKQLILDCKKINIFIGKPNTGKSNILESIGIFSVPYEDLSSFIRFENMSNLFYDQDLMEMIEIKADDLTINIKYEDDKFIGTGGNKEKELFAFDFEYDFTKKLKQSSSFFRNSPFKSSPIKYYKFMVLDKFTKYEFTFLLPPKGENLLSILLTNKLLRKEVADILSEYGLRVVLKPQDSKIEVQKEIDAVIISYPYSLVSDTLQRVVFYLVAMETNRDSVIIFEEPESHAFPYYTKFLAERIALDKNNNQYFISTHNPYFLVSVIEKSLMEDIGIFITYFEDYQTKVLPLTKKQLPEILDLDASIFFNLDQFLESE